MLYCLDIPIYEHEYNLAYISYIITFKLNISIGLERGFEYNFKRKAKIIDKCSAYMIFALYTEMDSLLEKHLFQGFNFITKNLFYIIFISYEV